MAFEGGLLAAVGITPSYLKGLATQTLSNGAQVALGQIWQGAGRSFPAKVGQQLTGALADSVINIALNAATGEEVGDVGGILLNTGTEVLAPALTQYLTGPLANQINDSIAKSLESAGPFGPVLSSAAGGLVSTALGGIGGAISGALFGGGGGVTEGGGEIAAGGANATNYITFPGGGDEPPSSYRANPYTLEDVVFSLKPANKGPQSDGDAQALGAPTSGTKIPFTDYTSMPPTAGNPLVNALKQSDMGSIGKPGEVLIGSYTGLSGSGYDIYKVPGSVGSDENIGGYADPLGPLRGTEWDNLRPRSRETPLW